MSHLEAISDDLFAQVLKQAATAWAEADQNAIIATEALMQDAFSSEPLLTPEQRAEALSFLGIEVAGND